MTRTFFLASLATLLACGAQPQGGVVLDVDTDSLNATRVSVTISPANITQDLTQDPANPSRFTSSIVVPAVTQTISVQAFAGPTLVGTGSATATVTKGLTFNVSIKVLDVTGPVGGPDHAPVVTSLVTPASVQAGDTPTLTSTAVDPDTNPITYLWTASPLGCGTFTPANAATTVFTASASLGPCTVTITATANTKSDSKSATIQIAAATGTLGITVNYVPQPTISSIAFSQGATNIATALRDGDATLRAPFHYGQAYTVTVSYDAFPTGTFTLTDSCGGAITNVAFSPASGTATWTPLTGSTLCNITANLTRDTFADGGLLSDSMFATVLPVQ